jgi:nucleoid DNA-binding protein
MLARVIDSIGQIVTDGLKSDGDAIIPGIAKFKTVHKAATDERQGINPFTKAPVTIPARPASVKVKVVPAKPVKDAFAVGTASV